MVEKKIDTGAYAYQEGDAADVAYVLVSGKIEIIDIEGGNEIRADIIEPGGVFGDLVVFDAACITRQSSARAMEPSVMSSITPEDFRAQLAQCPPSIQPFLQLACDKMKATKRKHKVVHAESVLESDISKITIAPATEKLKELIKPVEIVLSRLPFRIGGYPESGEVSRRDQLHLAIPSQENPLRVSRLHCEIGIENKALVITDLGSRFCTIVNGSMIGRGRGNYVVPLKKGANDVTLGAAEGPYKLTITCK